MTSRHMRRPRLVALGILCSAVVLVVGPAATAGRVSAPLAGTWGIKGADGGTQFLTLADSRFMFFSPTSPDVPSSGEVSVTGTTITFYSSNRCAGTGTYEWSLSEGGLSFVQVAGSNDPCRRASFLTSGVWARPG